VLLSRSAQLFYETHVRPTLALGGRIDELYLQLQVADGDPVPVLMNGVRTAHDGTTRDTFVVVPMHRRALFERELIRARQDAEQAAERERAARAQSRELQAQLRRQERLVLMGQLAAGVAHEVNNPLTYILGNLDLLRVALATDGHVPSSDLATWLEEMRRGANQIRHVVAGLRRFARAEEDPLEPVDLGVVVDTALKFASAEIRARAVVERDVSSPAPLVVSRESQLTQVALNLLVNAAQALPPERAAENRVRVRVYPRDRGHAVLEVSDNGPGVPKDLEAKIFEPFFTTKPVGEGMGLGLSLSHRIVSELGGSLTLRNTPGAGATFVVTLPVDASGQV
jgi:C4-dicarboxylate-specific signal transduction histidine kinase